MYEYGSLVKRLRRRPLTAETAVRFRYELRRKPRKHQCLRGLLYHKWVVSEWLVTIFRL